METQSQKVLIVDDNSDIRAVVKEILSDAGYATLEAADGIDALDMLLAIDVPLIVLLDVNMPRMSGCDLLHVLVDQEAVAGRHAYILVSASTERALEQAVESRHVASFVQRHAIPVIAKPFEIDALLQAVSSASTRLLAAIPSRPYEDASS